MTMAAEMQVTLRLPVRQLFAGRATRLTATAENGAFGMLPNHIDFVTALIPCVLTLSTPGGEELFFGVDEGLLVKRGHAVDVAVRRGVRGEGLESLRDTVARSFLQIDEEERAARSALSGLEANLVRRFTALRRHGS